MLIIGIDPGITGAICFFDNGEVSDIIEIPSMAEGKKNKRQINGPQIYNEISRRIEGLQKKNIAVVIEQVSAMPGQGVTSMFNFGQSFGVLKGICSAMKMVFLGVITIFRPNKISPGLASTTFLRLSIDAA